MKDVVEHPEHYATGKYQCIDVMEEALGKDYVLGFCICNAFKYIYRLRHKGDPVINARKAVWYLTKYLELVESKIPVATEDDCEDTK